MGIIGVTAPGDVLQGGVAGDTTSLPAEAVASRDPLDLDALSTLCKAATLGPWKVVSGSLTGASPNNAITQVWVTTPDEYVEFHIGPVLDNENPLPDAEFIATARTALPVLIERVRVLEGRFIDVRTHWVNRMEGLRERAESAERERDDLHAKVAKVLAVISDIEDAEDMCNTQREYARVHRNGLRDVMVALGLPVDDEEDKT